ncbi:MAG TPA: cellulase family glycosylhydrolase [Acidimicrobiia bacterium]|nr:cellulase family glycosylhydrolase [Acidimicrobiia bacterium]
MTGWRWAAIPLSAFVLSAGLITPAGAQPVTSPTPACARASGTPPTSVAPVVSSRPAPRLSPLALPALPLRTRGPRIVDGRGRDVTLASVNWYGAEEQDYIVGGLDRRPLDAIAREIRALGFNTVRLPWSNALLHDNPVVCDGSVAANPRLRGQHALTVLDAVVRALGAQGIMVVLDNHMTTADWCCLPTDDNNLWYNAAPNPSQPAWLQHFDTAQWLADWQTMIRRYGGLQYRNVIAVDLRNEPRGSAAWGTQTGPSPGCRPPAQNHPDWHDAAQRGAACVLAVNPGLLVMVEGVAYSLLLDGAATAPVVLPAGHGHQLVYSPHNYSQDQASDVNADPVRLAAQLNQHWGFLASGSAPTPIWVGEFGTCHTATLQCGDDHDQSHAWITNLARFITGNRFGWAWWPLNGTQSRGITRVAGDEESFGVLDTTWSCQAQAALTLFLAQLPGTTRGADLPCAG